MEVSERPERHMARRWHAEACTTMSDDKALMVLYIRYRWSYRSDTWGQTRISVSNNYQKAHEIPLEDLDRMIGFIKRRRYLHRFKRKVTACLGVIKSGTQWLATVLKMKRQQWWLKFYTDWSFWVKIWWLQLKWWQIYSFEGDGSRKQAWRRDRLC